ncbi:MAG TPA: alpha-isopropylmalate synthase regulatory domain-containing protein [Spirochaetota bacterium]|nr:alpha-isopropylmalate synthase regulatory domain-containing protein [Spirochaetota bacterium]HOS33943.1 alpha-isopropylmalate synthase regulatory domain-containing protein [Spirochaetota bacterium]HOS55545.1 alpha-isopropylmalate synthase regulatory domain-containing protein [Spirochaetota bacterium]HPK62148.1 alpha-isopropylmalate synthase regulatory domain-containing protein [Spirochaetota bacterium]HQF77530.1 alpha-isopropylmalate synthase regulatory domain-containing protein [Spirochaeto
MKKIEIMDTTLRDGEQMQNVSYTADEKLTIAQILLQEVKVDRLEITSARASEGEKVMVRKITDWAEDFGFIKSLEILSFVDKEKSVDWAKSVGIKRINLLTKGSRKHCEKQLGKSLSEHLADIEETVDYAVKNDIEVNIYLEDFSGGILNSPDYLFEMVDRIVKIPVIRIMLPDTLGMLEPFTVYEKVKLMADRYPGVKFDYHPHNDYGLGTANALAAARAGISGLHTTVNGLGERAGNSSLDEVVVGLKDLYNIETNIDETKLYKVSKFVEMFSGQRLASNKPIYGSNVFTQTAGIHADGDKKGDLYANKLIPERFGRTREYALGKLAGKANLDINLKKLGIELDAEKKKILLNKIVELGDKKESITLEDLPYLISDIFEVRDKLPFKLVNCVVNTTYQFKPFSAVKCSYNGKTMEAYSYGDGGYDAFMNSLKQILQTFGIEIPKLSDYIVTIPPGGKTDALVQTTIYWEPRDKESRKTIVTKGINSDQIMAAIEATIRMVNIILTMKTDNNSHQ